MKPRKLNKTTINLRKLARMDSGVIRDSLPFCIAILFYLIVKHLYVIGYAAVSIVSFISPVIFGIVLAYIMDPPIRILERKLAVRSLRGKPIQHPRGISITVVVLGIVLGLLLLAAAVLPQVFSSVVQFSESGTAYHQTLQESVDRIAGKSVDLTQVFTTIDGILEKVTEKVQNYIETKSGDTGRALGNFAIDFILAIYFLVDKKRLMAGANKLFHLLLPDKACDQISSSWKRADAIFIKYIACEVIDALIIGAANAVFMLIARMPYVPMISAVVGVTNLIPTFGPLIGAAVGTFVLLISNPLQAIVFLFFTGALQMVDGYVIKPKLYGGSLGVPGIWILIAVILGGRLFGAWGMLLAIPFAAILDIVLHENVYPWLEARKAKKSEDSESEEAVAAAVSNSEEPVSGNKAPAGDGTAEGEDNKDNIGENTDI